MSSSFLLASGSPRRKELLTLLDYQFDIIIPNIEERQNTGELPQDYVARLSREKAQAGLVLAKEISPHLSLPVLGADTIVVIGHRVLEKPVDYNDSKNMLQQLSGGKHQVMTSVTVADHNRFKTTTVVTDVWFKVLTESEIQAYWQSGEPCDKAGSYGIQGIGGRFVSRIEGSYHAVMGLPLMETDLLLTDFL